MDSREMNKKPEHRTQVFNDLCLSVKSKNHLSVSLTLNWLYFHLI